MVETEHPLDTPKRHGEDPLERSNPRLAMAAALLFRPEREREQRIQMLDGQYDVSRDAWENPGRFEATVDGQGRTRRIEGWLAAAPHQQGHDGHLIAPSLGGPTAESQDTEIVRRNVELRERRMFRRHLDSFEAHLSEHLRDHADHMLYMQVDVAWLDDDGVLVTHRVFERDADGRIARHAAFECVTSIAPEQDSMGPPLQEHDDVGKRGRQTGDVDGGGDASLRDPSDEPSDDPSGGESA